MIRFIHASDVHLDSPFQGLEEYEGAPGDVLRGATRRAFENLIQLAIDENIDFLVIAGDLYDGDWKDYSTGLFFRGQMVRLRDKNIPVYLIAGNHDAASVISRKLSLPENVHVFSNRTAESMEVVGHPVVVHGRGFPNRAVPENLAVDYPVAVPNMFNLGLLHTSLTGRAGHDTYAPCSETDLRPKGYGYWALGHIHQPEVISQDPWIVFAGNCQGRDAREVGPRGCWLVTVDDSLIVEKVEWQDLDVVRWQVLEIDLAGVTEETEAFNRTSRAMANAISEAEGRLVAVRIVFTGATQLHGSLHRDFHRWRAELLARVQDQGSDTIWLERIKISTSPIYDLATLAERDALTKIVLETLEQARIEPGNLPDEIKEMLNILSPEVRRDVEYDLSEIQRETEMEDIRAIILHSLEARGGQV